MSNLPSVTVIVLNYNGLRHLQDCFSSLLKLDYPKDKLELMLVDNASKDGSVGYVKASYPQVRIVCNKDNLGFASGNNCGAREATGEYIIFLNNDMWVDPQFVRGLVKAVQSEPGVVSAGAKILNWDGTRIDFAGAICNYAGYAAQVGFDQPYDPEQFNEIKPMLFACGGAMIVNRQVFLDVGGFDDDYFIYFEDVDLGWRLWLLGYKVVFAPDAITNHRHHGTMKSFSNSRQMVLYKRNSLYTVIKNYSDENLGRILPAILLSTASGVVEQAVASGQLDKDAFYIKSTNRLDDSPISLDKLNVSALVAMQDVVENLPQIMEKRRFIQQRRQRSDQEIAHLFQPFFLENIPGVSQRTSYAATAAFDVQKIFANVSRRVLIISPDLLPYPGLPTVGSGLRAWGLGQGLKSRGHEVIFSIPLAALKAFENVVAPEVLNNAWDHSRMIDTINKVQPDIILVCGWANMPYFPQYLSHIPVIIDQHGPHILERQFQGHGERESNAQEKSRALQKADFFTCAGDKQLIYFQSWLEQAGWTEQERQERSAAMPISLSPNLPERSPQDELSFVYGGVFLPWQDPSLSLSVLIDIMEQRNAGKLYLFGGKHPWLSIDTGIFDTLLAQLQKSSHVIAPGTVPHNELIAKYTSAHVAIDLMKRNSERELAFTTRTVEYLWCGLPVIYNDYAELSDYIREYDAGWIVDPEDTEAIAAVINEIFDHPEIVAEKSQNAQRLVREKLNWEKTIDSIDQFVRHPSMRYRPLLNPPTVPVVIEKLRTAPVEIEKLQARLRGMNSSKFWQLRQAWCQLKRKIGLGRNKVELVEQLQPLIQSNQVEPETLSQLIRAMESSKFWKLRTAWFRLKRTVGLGANE
ncbi:MAG: glycosyltransferase [Spirirestis rafaelensis WJT71-NPBG6]|jgi:GT2 family glycosyltransferase|nr:glycosyltransferase [Spirirestis rafaelensis WJT71-NPBG6]